MPALLSKGRIPRLCQAVAQCQVPYLLLLKIKISNLEVPVVVTCVPLAARQSLACYPEILKT